jgi:hypothetical protein
MQGVRKVGGKPSLEVLTYRLRNLQASSGTYASSLRLALLATRVLTVGCGARLLRRRDAQLRASLTMIHACCRGWCRCVSA